MSLIPCTQYCKFQSDGLCMLSQTDLSNHAAPNEHCLNFTPRSSDQSGDGFSDRGDPNQIQSFRRNEFPAVSGRDQTFGEAKSSNLR